MKRLLAQLKESTKSDYDPEEKGEVVRVGEHHGGDMHVYFAHKVTKLREVQANNWKDWSSAIFKGCIIYINGLTDPPIDEMRRLIGSNGGECIQYRAIKITHLVCNYFTDAQLKLEYAKIKLNASNRVYYVTDDWVKESVRHGRRLDENEFVPAGMNKQPGKTLSALLSKNSSAPSATVTCAVPPAPSASMHEVEASQNGDLQALKRRRRAHGSGAASTPVDACATLTSSQHDFISSLPHELRADALMQIESMRECTYVKSNVCELQSEISAIGSSSSSSSSSSTRHSGPTGGLSLDCALDAVSVVPQDSALRKQSLTELVHHLHRNSDGTHCSSKATRQRVGQYLQQLVASLVAAMCPPAYRLNTAALAELFGDYIRWLCGESKYDQVTLPIY